jgi:succinoglycan biosynthesis transport protein ExoP
MLEGNTRPEKAASERLSTSQELMRLTPTFVPGPLGGHGDHFGNHQGGADGINVRELWRKIRKRKWLIMTVVALATTIVAIESFRVRSTYQASAKVAVAKDPATLFPENKVIVQADDADKIKTEMLLLTTYPLKEEVVRRLRLDQQPKFLEVEQKKTFKEALGTLIGRLRRPLQVTNSSPAVNPIHLSDENLAPLTEEESARLEPFVEVLGEYLYVDQIPETRALMITYTHTEPLLASAVANGAAQVLLDRSFQNKTSGFNKSAAWLDDTTRKLQAQVQQSEQALADYSRANNIFSTEGKETLTADKLASLHSEVLKAETDRVLKQSIYEEVKQGRVARLPDAFSDPKTNTLQAKLGDLQVQSAQLNVKFGPDNPRVAEIAQQIVELEKLLSDTRRKLEEKLRADYERATRDEQSLKNSLERAKDEAVQQNQAAIQFSILKQRVDTAKVLYNDFLSKTNQANFQLAEQNPDLRIIEPARIPSTTVGPRRVRSVLIGMLLSLVAGVGLALLLEYLDNTVKNVEDVTRATQLPTLALIPAISQSAMKVLNAKRKSAVIGGLLNEESGGENSDIAGLAPRGLQPLGDELVTLDGLSSVVEAYRMLRTSVLLSSAGHPPKTILVTSSQPSEGKTTTAVNTAISLANLGLSVLLIDSDLRRPALHKQFKITQTRGLSTYLSSSVPLESVVVSLPIPNLFLMPCGPVPPNPAELIASERMRELIRTVGQHYDHVLIDSPPLMNVTDPAILSTLVDGVILVVQAGRSTREIVRRAKQDLRSVGARIFGVVLNNVDLKREGYYDYYYYRYHSNYGEKGSDAEVGQPMGS